MGLILSVYNFVQLNGAAIMAALFCLWGFAEFIVRLTPTKKDDTALERIGKVLKAVFDACGMPNRRTVDVQIKTDLKAEAKPEDEKAA